MIAYVSVVKRSPILGYNHNVRYRGLVFHVQTEDSGVQSPHVFTHLFHGGVILSTRKLVYDAGASEDVIRSLMQAQHRATLKELRRGQYDDKIDEYLGGYAGLLPRGSGAEEEGEGDVRESGIKNIEAELSAESRAITRNPAITSSSPAITPPPPPAVTPPPASTAAPASSSALPAPLPAPPIPPAGAARPKTGPMPPLVTFRDGSEGEPKPARAPTDSGSRLASMGAASLPPLPTPPQPGRTTGTGTAPRMSAAAPPRPAITQPVVVARDLTEQTSSGKLATVPDSSEIYSPPPPSAELPPGAAAAAEHPGAYSVRRREGTPDPHNVPTVRPGSSSEAAPLPAAPRPATAAGSSPARPVPRSPTPAPIAPRNRATGGVVMSRPAVIVGSSRTTPPPAGAAGAKRADDQRRGFGQGLISEKSLDEVILAYLSEDANDE